MSMEDELRSLRAAGNRATIAASRLPGGQAAPVLAELADVGRAIAAVEAAWDAELLEQQAQAEYQD